MNKVQISLSYFGTLLMMVAFMSFALHSGVMAAGDSDGQFQFETALSHEHLQPSAAGHHATSVATVEKPGVSTMPRQPGDDHDKGPCKSRCCSSSCTLALAETPSVLAGVWAAPETLLAVPRTLAVKSNDLDSFRRPPRAPLIV